MDRTPLKVETQTHLPSGSHSHAPSVDCLLHSHRPDNGVIACAMQFISRPDFSNMNKLWLAGEGLEGEACKEVEIKCEEETEWFMH